MFCLKLCTSEADHLEIECEEMSCDLGAAGDTPVVDNLEITCCIALLLGTVLPTQVWLH
jgi:hypothetical protein